MKLEKYLKLDNYLFHIIRKFDFIIGHFDQKFIKKYYNDDTIPPIFIVGAPRTGSTIFYQVITSCMNVGYINNLESMFANKILFGQMLSKIFYDGAQHNSFSSYHGTTRGLNSPSECGDLWYRWFPRKNHFVEGQELTTNNIKELKRVINSLIIMKKKPLVIKNMNCGQRIRVLKKVFPDAIFIFCRREAVYTAQSILKVRKRIFNRFDKWWSIKPKEYKEIICLEPEEQVVAQIFYIEKEIQESLNKLYCDRFIEIWYEDFCNKPFDVIDRTVNFLRTKGVDVIKCKNLPFKKIKFNNSKELDEGQIEKIKFHIERYFK